MQKPDIKIFNKVYSSKDMYYGFEIEKIIKNVLGKLDLKNKRVLDIGCGEGRHSIYFAKKGCKVFSIDAAEKGIEKLRKISEEENLDINAKVLDVENYNFQPSKFDIVIASTILGHLNKAAREKLINGIKKTTKPGGYIYVSAFTKKDPGYNHSINEKGVSDTSLPVGYYFNKGELENYFSEFKEKYYSEDKKPDFKHGKFHYHGFATLIARK